MSLAGMDPNAIYVTIGKCIPARPIDPQRREPVTAF
jgi:hypothetical protein